MLQHDPQGFLIGEVIPDIRRQTEILTGIRADIAEIRRIVKANGGQLPRGTGNPPQPGPAPEETLGGGPGLQNNSSPGSNTAEPNPRGERANRAGAAGGDGDGPALPPTSDQPPASPNGRRLRRSRTNQENPDSEPRNRDSRGRFSSNEEGEANAQRSIFNGLIDRFAEAVTVDTGLEDVDPTVKAFNEVAQPLARSWEVLAGGDKDDQRWFRRIFSELKLFRRDETVFNRAANRSLRNLEDRPSGNGGDEGSGSFFGGFLGSVVGKITAIFTTIGAALLAGATTVIGAIFSPIGLAIGGLATAAWGLFTEDGRKFFANVADKIYVGWYQATDYIKGKWDEGVKVFSDLWEPIAKFFEDKFGIVGETAKSAAEAVSNTAEKANDFVKDKTGVDVKQVAQSAYEKATDFASRTIIEPIATTLKNGADSVKAIPKKLKDHWQEAKQYLGDAAEKAGIDPGILAKIANFESEFNSEARPIRKKDGKVLSSAHGYGQFLDSTWTEMVNRHGAKYGVLNAGRLSKTEAAKLRSDKALQAAMLAEFTKENLEKGRQLGGTDDSANIYALHNLGSGDGSKFLKALKQNPNAKVGDILSQKVISGNKSLYGDGNMTIAEAYSKMGAAMNRGEAFAREIRMPASPLLPIQSVSAPSPSMPSLPKPAVIAEAPQIQMPIASDADRQRLTVSVEQGDVGQDLSDRRIAHIVTGGLSAGV
jgi:hypothetical protein